MLFPAASVQAATVTVGSPLTQSFDSLELEISGTFVNFSLPEAGANATSPISGAILRWRVLDATGGPFELRVLKPDGGGTYTPVGTSAPESPTALTTQTFTASLPIQAGDTIALYNTNASDRLGWFSSLAGAGFYAWVPPLAENTARAPNFTVSGSELAFNADVQPPPGIITISPNSGSISGGTSVLIAGHDFEGATAVKFGSTLASSFTVNSETAVTAVAPPSATPGPADITLTTAAGTTAINGVDRFTYTPAPSPPLTASCTVPKLTGKRLKVAKKLLGKAECKLGKVKGHKSRSAKVTKQSAKPGTVLTAGSKVNVKIS